MVIADPPSYLDALTFRASISGLASQIVCGYTDAQLQAVLTDATARADGMMGQTLLAREETHQYNGTGSATLDLDETPLLYIRRITFAQPGLGSLAIPSQNLLIDYDDAELVTFVPLFLQGSGYVSTFPRGVRLAITAGYGYGRKLDPPKFAAADTLSAGASFLPVGSYDVAVTAASFAGETAAGVPVRVACVSGGIAVTVQAVLGASSYRVYLAPAGTTPLLYVASIPAASFSAGPLVTTVYADAVPTGEFAEVAPSVDTSALAPPAPVVAATRLLALDAIQEEASPASVGIAKDGDTQYASTAKSSALMRATMLLEPYLYRGVM